MLFRSVVDESHSTVDKDMLSSGLGKNKRWLTVSYPGFIRILIETSPNIYIHQGRDIISISIKVDN